MAINKITTIGIKDGEVKAVDIGTGVIGTTHIGTVNISDLADVDDSSRAASKFLSWSTANSKWEADTVSGGTLATLTDVATAANPADNNKFLKFNGTTFEWDTVSQSATIDSLTDTNITSLADNQILQYDTNTSKWLNATLSGGTLATLTDVGAVTSSEDTYILYYDHSSTSFKWTAQSGAASITRSGPLTATAGQTIFTFAHQTDSVDVYVNGLKVTTSDFSSNGTAITMSSSLSAGDIVEIIDIRDTIATTVAYSRSAFTASGGETYFDHNTSYTVGYVDIFLNGIKLPQADYDASATVAPYRITFNNSASINAGDLIEILAYNTLPIASIDPTLHKTYTKEKFTFVSGTAVFTTANSFTDGLLDVWVNGIKLPTDDYSTSGGNQVTITNSGATHNLVAGDIVEVIYWEAFNATTTHDQLAQINHMSHTATAGQTIFTATYAPGHVDVFMNGIKLLGGTDYSEQNGQQITLIQPAQAGDIIQIRGFSRFAQSNTTRFTTDAVTATAGQTTITMSETPPSADSLLVTVNGIVQRATTDYTINNNILTFTVGLDADDIIVIKGLGYVAGNYTPQSSSVATSHLVGEFALQNDDTYNSAVTLGSASKNTAMVGPLTFNNTLTIGGVVTVI